MATLQTFATLRPPPWLSGWIAANGPTLAELTGANPALAALVDALPDTRWTPDFLVPPPTDVDTEFETELALIGQRRSWGRARTSP